MWGKLIAATAVLIIVLVVCAGAARIVLNATETIRFLSIRAAAAAENGETAEAESLLGELLMTLDERRPVLEVLVMHDDINEIQSLAIEARIQLRHGEDADFAASMALIAEALTVLDERQTLTIGNLF